MTMWRNWLKLIVLYYDHEACAAYLLYNWYQFIHNNIINYLTKNIYSFFDQES